jgi:hypothetical protein
VKVTKLIFLLTFGWLNCKSQYCGNSGAFQCPAVDTAVATGFFPPPDSFPSLINNTPVSAIIQFRNLDSIVFGTEVLHVYAISFDTIVNLPSGLCWATDQANNTYTGGQTGCLRITGTPCDNTGQYELDPLLNVDIGVNVYTDGEPGGLKYYLRLKNYGDNEIPVDNTQADSIPFIAYGGACAQVSPLSVSLGPDDSVCNGSFASVYAVVAGGQPPFTYMWQSVGSSLSCDTCSFPTTVVNENSTFIVVVTDAQGNSATDSVNYTAIGATYNFQILPLGPVLFCDTGTIVLISSPGNGFSYQWFLNDYALAGATDSTLSVTDSSGSYTLNYNLPGICSAISNTVSLSFFNTPFDSIATIGTANLCQGSYVQINAYTSAGVTYQWQVNGANAPDSFPLYFVAITPGVYDLIVTNSAQCSVTSNQITVLNNSNFPPNVTLNPFSPDSVCSSSAPMVLTGGSPSGGYFTGPGVSNNSFYADSGIIGENFITYIFTDTTGCSSSASAVLVDEICAGINEAVAEETILVYPNPASSTLVIESPLFSTRTMPLLVYDATGRLVQLDEFTTGDKIILNVSNLSPGLYVLQCRINGNSWIRKKFIKIE